MKHRSSQQRHGQAWLPEEEQELREAFLEGMSIPELANRHERGNAAIQKRLERLGLIEAKNAVQSTPALRPVRRLRPMPERS